MEAAYNFDGYRRLSVRKIYQKEVSFSTGSKVFPATIENLSRDGALLGIRSISKIKTGAIIIISIPFANKQGCVKSKAIVMWAGKNKLGIQFFWKNMKEIERKLPRLTSARSLACHGLSSLTIYGRGSWGGFTMTANRQDA